MLSSLSVTIRHLLLVRGLAATSCLHVRRDYASAQRKKSSLDMNVTYWLLYHVVLLLLLLLLLFALR